jgi:hypothetical protein
VSIVRGFAISAKFSTSLLWNDASPKDALTSVTFLGTGYCFTAFTFSGERAMPFCDRTKPKYRTWGCVNTFSGVKLNFSPIEPSQDIFESPGVLFRRATKLYQIVDINTTFCPQSIFQDCIHQSLKIGLTDKPNGSLKFIIPEETENRVTSLCSYCISTCQKTLKQSKTRKYLEPHSAEFASSMTGKGKRSNRVTEFRALKCTQNLYLGFPSRLLFGFKKCRR